MLCYFLTRKMGLSDNELFSDTDVVFLLYKVCGHVKNDGFEVRNHALPLQLSLLFFQKFHLGFKLYNQLFNNDFGTMMVFDFSIKFTLFTKSTHHRGTRMNTNLCRLPGWKPRLILPPNYL